MIFEVFMPGAWINHPNPQRANEIEAQIDLLQSLLFEANTALIMFNEASARAAAASTERMSMADRRRRAEISQEIDKSFPGNPTHQDHLEMIYEADVRFKREKWGQGRLPVEFSSVMPFICARAFLFAIDSFERTLGALSRESNVPNAVKSAHAQLRIELPHLREVRNSAHHIEDRSRGIYKDRSDSKPIDLKPINSEFIKAGAGSVLILSGLNGSKYGCTMKDGQYGEVDVSVDTLSKVGSILHDVMNAFSWRGSPMHRPSA